MKFLCITEFFHSGHRLYTTGTVYSDITAKTAEELIALDKSKPIGALSFFTPIDEEAKNFVKGKIGEGKPATAGTETPGIKEPTKAELVREAKELGLKATNFMTIEQLKEIIEAAKKPQQPDTAAIPDGAETPSPQE
jgi:hypothetical protein